VTTRNGETGVGNHLRKLRRREAVEPGQFDAHETHRANASEYVDEILRRLLSQAIQLDRNRRFAHRAKLADHLLAISPNLS
jgi:hypothetical protein